jgi:hypothetical protein
VTGTLKHIQAKLKYFYGIARRAESIYALLARMYREPLLAAEKTADPRALTPYGFSAYSQTDEDGIFQEIFRRIGTTNKTLIDFGCAEGVENNTTYLILTGWRGLWMDGGAANIRKCRRDFRQQVEAGRLTLKHAFITRENINELIREAGLPKEIDILSIDIDGNDYWIWEAIDCVSPRVVAIEYNTTFRPPAKVVQVYDAQYRPNYSNDFGASLKALECLGARKGYSLTGCSFSGANAFFVRNDLVKDLFSAPFTAEHHYREPQYDAFVRGYNSHRKAIGLYEVIE